ncbi:unnamed protein product [Strongylus vulgaris]|uniref:Uncharacterized protein n=1 Tax=Strongylus vulgaris TaxID=40348 RepID=A0A3P7JHI1_STRVU|nr:unnamed protein product [Strongylus vulgaris]
MIGGEGPENGKWAANPEVSVERDKRVQYLQWASEFGAHVFDLEHRFFGDSWPKPNMNFDTLSLLTTEQALADLAYFITSMNQKYGFNNPRWVTFGGSYPVVQDDLNITNQDCPSIVRQAFQKMENLSKTTDGLMQLNSYFNLQPPFTNASTTLDITNFFANVYSVFQSMTQYTYDGRNAESEQNLTDAKLCQIMMNPNVADVPNCKILRYNEITGDPNSDLTVFPNSYTDMINSVGTGDLKVLGDNGEFFHGGRFRYYIDMCSDMFDPSVNLSYITPRNIAAQNYYGGSDKYQVSYN